MPLAHFDSGVRARTQDSAVHVKPPVFPRCRVLWDSIYCHCKCQTGGGISCFDGDARRSPTCFRFASLMELVVHCVRQSSLLLLSLLPFTRSGCHQQNRPHKGPPTDTRNPPILLASSRHRPPPSLFLPRNVSSFPRDENDESERMKDRGSFTTQSTGAGKKRAQAQEGTHPSSFGGREHGVCHQTPSHVMMFAGQKRPGRTKCTTPPSPLPPSSPNDVG